MKRLLLILFIVTSAINGQAQNSTISRLKTKLLSTDNKSVKASVLDSLSMYYMFFYHRSDSTFYYCNEYINQAVQLQDKRFLTLAYARLSFYDITTGQYKESLSAGLKGLDLSEKYHIDDYLSALYYDLTWAYDNLGEPREGLKNGFKGITYLKKNKDPFFDQRLHLYGIIGYSYSLLNKNDSAMRYLKKMESVAATSKERGAKVIADWNWAIYYLNNTQQYKETDSWIEDGKKQCEKTGHFLINSFYLFASQSYLAQNKTGQAIEEARSAFRLSVPISDISAQNQAADLLSASYEKLKKLDSAYRYLKMADSLNAAIQTHTNALDVQQSRFDQQINQKEQAAAAGIQEQKNRSRISAYVFVTALAFMVMILLIQLRHSKQKRKANEILQQQKEKVESTLTELKSTQAQLIQREKMASLGELTAGIAHEIQNPLNFVNNFSEVNREMISELREALQAGDITEALAIANDVDQNEEKINHHGKRADGIVKGMLEHSHATNMQKEPTDMNKLADECLKLAYGVLRAKDKSFNSELITQFDPALPPVIVNPQDIGRVLLNLFNNAFYAVKLREKTEGNGFIPEVKVSTSVAGNFIRINVIDNGTGIPDEIKDKIMQPFFTTKPTGEGTGLGLSLSYDIITKGHGGTINVKSEHGKYSEFEILLPADF
jgi:two-component system NtrC family sensor kinase